MTAPKFRRLNGNEPKRPQKAAHETAKTTQLTSLGKLPL
jgi:hypothetical protein